MQPFSQGPGANWAVGVSPSLYTPAQIVALLQANPLTPTPGLDLLDGNNNWLADITTNLVSWSLTRNNTATVHGSGSFVVSQAIQGGSQRVRPYMMLSGAGLSNVRWDLGVYLLTTPVLELSETPATYTITGTDLLYYLQNQIGDTYTVPAGTTYLNAVAAVIAASGITGSQILLDQTAAAAAVPSDLVWALTGDTGTAYGGAGGSTTSYLDVANELLASIAYLPLWADWEGDFRSSPYRLPQSLASEFTFDLTQIQGVQVSNARQLTNELWQAVNWWRYLNSTVTGVPVEGAGQYTYINSGAGPSSVIAVGRNIRQVITVAAPDQPTLVGVATQAISQAIANVAQLQVAVSPFPPAWHFDRFTYIDSAMPAGQTKVQVQSQGWTINSDGSDGAQTWQVV